MVVVLDRRRSWIVRYCEVRWGLGVTEGGRQVAHVVAIRHLILVVKVVWHGDGRGEVVVGSVRVSSTGRLHRRGRVERREDRR